MHPPDEEFSAVWDLGDQWCRWAELPFVFAMWTARDDTDLRGVDEALCAARDAGVANLEEIADLEAEPIGLGRDACLAYLRENLYFFLGPQELQGLETFYRHAVRLGAAPAGCQFQRIPSSRTLRESAYSVSGVEKPRSLSS